MKSVLCLLAGLSAALPAAAQVVILPAPRLALPATPLAHPLTPVLPESSLRMPDAAPMPGLHAPAPVPAPLPSPTPRTQTKGDVEGPAPASAHGLTDDALANALVVRVGASEEFHRRVRALVASLPPAVLRVADALGYRVQVKEHVTQGRPDLEKVDDKGGGLHDWGEKGNFVIVAEKVLVDLPDADGVFRGRAEWQESLYWENAALHELGHVLDRAFGFSGDAALKAALDADYADIPAGLKGPNLPDGRVNKLYYFLQTEGGKVSALSRGEICAEAFDVLLRGERSAYNHANFTTHLPRTLAALRSALETRLGPLGLRESLVRGPFRALIGPVVPGGDAQVEIFYRGTRYSDPMSLTAAAVANGEQALLGAFFKELDAAVRRHVERASGR